MKRMKRWFVHLPGEVYANNWYGPDKRDVLRQVREWLRRSRLPRGVTIWRG